MKTIYALLLCLLCLSGCSQPDVNEVSTSLSPVRFSVYLTEEVLPYTRVHSPDSPGAGTGNGGGTGSGGETGENSGGGEETGGGGGDAESDVSDWCNTIEYIVYAANNTETAIKHITQTQTAEDDDDADFHIFYDELPVGTYKIVFIAYQKTSSAETGTLSGNRMSFNEVFDTFHHVLTLTVSAGQPVNEDVDLARIIGRIEFWATDAVPATAKTFTVQANYYPRELDVISGKGIVTASSAFSTVHTFTEAEKGAVGMTYSFLTFVPEEEETMDITTIATDNANAILRQRSVPDVTPKSNRTIRYKGVLYTPPTSSDTFTVQILSEWEPTEEVELED